MTRQEWREQIAATLTALARIPPPLFGNPPKPDERLERAWQMYQMGYLNEAEFRRGVFIELEKT